MKFAHMADCHIGSYRDPRLRDISTQAFVKAIDACISEKVDFVLIAGDLFNTSLPSIDMLKVASAKLKELKDASIPVYLIAGSHDFSPSGKTMLDVLENAGLFVNVVKGEDVNGKLRLKFTTDPKTGVKLTGMLGRRGTLETNYYDSLDLTSLEEEPGPKIFLFHTALSELKPKGKEDMPSTPLSYLPKGFDYYAGGHVHIVLERDEPQFGKIVYPGPLFPNSFSEIEELSHGGFFIWENGTIRRVPIQIHPSESFSINADKKTAEEVEADILGLLSGKEFVDMIITIRVFGTLKSGKPSDIDWQRIFSEFYDKGAHFVMKNITKLHSLTFEEVKVNHSSTHEVEKQLVSEHLGKIAVPYDEKMLCDGLIKTLSGEKDEGEKVYEFEDRIKSEVDAILRSSPNA